jgi:hypothetical protein
MSVALERAQPNTAAGIVVNKYGTAAVTAEGLIAIFSSVGKLKARPQTCGLPCKFGGQTPFRLHGRHALILAN